ncbi:hypothetical protein PAXRUDRAFT_226346 [Paxillus rubicundulus Ve08.2h10]|uniref:Uncharacterized protein n=1 Tax=Paxillus rubicundulus Ve08.2h10 TaxID=930991 RepID=A0A0D0DP72_9AGAM|nr:hypothetical protein PAXRUDRAFT_226346 [Paxillus rubicundulus Ve08.2h10]
MMYDVNTGSCTCYHYSIIIDLFHFLGSLSVALVEALTKKNWKGAKATYRGNQVHLLVLPPQMIKHGIARFVYSMACVGGLRGSIANG